MRFKIPYGVGHCTFCWEPALSTDGERVVCKCGVETPVTQHGKELRKFARRVRKELRRAS